MDNSCSASSVNSQNCEQQTDHQISCECLLHEGKIPPSPLGDSVCSSAFSNFTDAPNILNVREIIKKYEPGPIKETKFESPVSARSIKISKSVTHTPSQTSNIGCENCGVSLNRSVSNHRSTFDNFIGQNKSFSNSMKFCSSKTDSCGNKSDETYEKNNLKILNKSGMNYKETTNHHVLYEEEYPVIHKEPVQEITPRTLSYRIIDQSTPPTIQKGNHIAAPYQSDRNCMLLDQCDINDVSARYIPLDKCVGTKNTTPKQTNRYRSGKNSDVSYQSKTTISKTPTGVRIITDIFFDTNIEPNWRGSRIETDIPPSKILKEFQEKNYLKSID